MQDVPSRIRGGTSCVQDWTFCIRGVPSRITKIAFPEFQTTFIAKIRFFRSFFGSTLVSVKSFSYLRVRF